MKILFAIGIAVSALLLTSCSNPDTSGGVTLSKDPHPSNAPFPHGACDDDHGFDKRNTGCGWVTANEKTYYIKPDANLYGADLYGAYLRGADLSGANLRNADLRRADLSGANLTLADLNYAGLYGANLSGANLRDAYLSGTDLSGANLSGANLSGVYLRYANLSGANLTLADLNFADLMLAKADSSTTCPNGKPWGIGGGGNCPF